MTSLSIISQKITVHLNLGSLKQNHPVADGRPRLKERSGRTVTRVDRYAGIDVRCTGVELLTTEKQSAIEFSTKSLSHVYIYYLTEVNDLDALC